MHASKPDSLRRFVHHVGTDEAVLLSLLRLASPPPLLVHVATTPPWSERPRLLGAVSRNPKTPNRIAMRLLPALYWRDLAEVAATLHLALPLRTRAEGLLRDQLADLRLGDRISLARIATPALLPSLLRDADKRVLDAALENPRLRERDVVSAIRSEVAPVRLLHAVARSRWIEGYRPRLALVIQTRTPLAVALAHMTSLATMDLKDIEANPTVAPLVARVATRILAGR